MPVSTTLVTAVLFASIPAAPSTPAPAPPAAPAESAPATPPPAPATPPAAPTGAPQPPMGRPEFLYKLSDLHGDLPMSRHLVVYDAFAREIYTAGDGGVRIFNSSGMEIYSYGDDYGIGGFFSIAALGDGDLLALSISAAKHKLVRLDYRGQPKGEIAMTGLPSELDGKFTPSGVVARNGLIYVVDAGSMRCVVLDAEGVFQKAYDLGALADIAEDERANNGVFGFNVDPNGNILFTVATIFRAFIVSPDGTARSFGQKGSTPGRFNIVTGIAGDANGNIFVVDSLRSVVSIWDRNLRFVREFGGRGGAPSSLASPRFIEVADGQVLISNGVKLGVSVFKLNQPKP